MENFGAETFFFIGLFSFYNPSTVDGEELYSTDLQNTCLIQVLSEKRHFLLLIGVLEAPQNLDFHSLPTETLANDFDTRRGSRQAQEVAK